MMKQLIPATGEVLIIHTWGIGDLILLTPVLRTVHTLYPQLKLSFLFFPHSAAIPIRGAAYVHSIQFTAWKPAILLKTILSLRHKRYD
ncbi:MAG: hypothetical protein RBS43_09195, partial [Candidatus Cloacimonas sp.]|nr:hypothetical protein [Candidatus Cloacimonas sp.]